MFRVVIHKRVSKELKNLQKAHLRKFAEVLEILKTNPVPWKEFDIKKIEEEDKTYRLKIDFRLIYFFDKENNCSHS